MLTVDDASKLGAFGPNLWRVMGGVILPGFLLLVEAFFILRPPDLVHSGPVAAELGWIPSLGTTSSLLFLLFTLSLSYGVGTVSRNVAFRFLHVPDRDYPLLHKALEPMETVFGKPAVRRAFDGHSHLAAIVDKQPPPETDNGVSAEVFGYCKLWLRVHHPDLGVDHKELEINLLFTLAGPFLVGAILAAEVGLPAPGSTRLASFGLALVMLGVFLGLGYQGRQEQKFERADALRNFVIANWFITPATEDVHPAGAAPSRRRATGK